MINPNEERPTDWFEPLYASSNTSGEGVPWANMQTHPYFQEWLETHSMDGQGKKAMVVGCGLGDDAIELENLGYEVTAFDVSESAIELCKKRFPESKVNFVQADLFNLPSEWNRAYDFVLEIYTVQALPPKYESESIRNIAQLVSESGELLVIAQVNKGPRDFAVGPPWLLTPDHRVKFEEQGLNIEETREKPTTSGNNMVFFTLFFRS